jgi:hypothetical protein
MGLIAEKAALPALGSPAAGSLLETALGRGLKPHEDPKDRPLHREDIQLT